MRVLELFSGIGGVAAAGLDIAAAYDHDEAAVHAYAATHNHPLHRKNLVSVRAPVLAAHNADLWWLSPPCQPFTVRGSRKGLADRRSQALVALLGVMSEVRPRFVALENVPGFEGSNAEAAVRTALEGYEIQTAELCPSQLGLPYVRRRYYLLAGRDGLPPLSPPPQRSRPLHTILDGEPPPFTAVPADRLERFGSAFHVVDPHDPDAVAMCFTGAYGHSPVYAGSYCKTESGVRLFSPQEIARIHGFQRVVLPDHPRKAYKLVGNSLSVDVVSWLLSGPRNHPLGLLDQRV